MIYSKFFLIIAIITALNAALIKLCDNITLVIIGGTLITIASLCWMYTILNMIPLWFCKFNKIFFSEIFYQLCKQKIILSGSPDEKESEDAKLWLNKRSKVIDRTWLDKTLMDWKPSNLSLSICNRLDELANAIYKHDFLILYKALNQENYNMLLKDIIISILSPNVYIRNEAKQYIDNRINNIGSYPFLITLYEFIFQDKFYEIKSYINSGSWADEEMDKCYRLLSEIFIKGPETYEIWSLKLIPECNRKDVLDELLNSNAIRKIDKLFHLLIRTTNNSQMEESIRNWLTTAQSREFWEEKLFLTASPRLSVSQQAHDWLINQRDYFWPDLFIKSLNKWNKGLLTENIIKVIIELINYYNNEISNEDLKRLLRLFYEYDIVAENVPDLLDIIIEKSDDYIAVMSLDIIEKYWLQNKNINRVLIKNISNLNNKISEKTRRILLKARAESEILKDNKLQKIIYSRFEYIASLRPEDMGEELKKEQGEIEELVAYCRHISMRDLTNYLIGG